MAKTRGFRLGRRIVRLGLSSCAARAMSKLCNWGRSLRHGVKGLCFGKRNSGYIRVGQEEPFNQSKPVNVPKGHLAVYVGEKDDGGACRVLVPVIYFNHPLFAELLREAETVYGFNHTGGIQIPCQKSKFENVKTRIAAVASGRRSWRRLLTTRGSDDHFTLDN